MIDENNNNNDIETFRYKYTLSDNIKHNGDNNSNDNLDYDIYIIFTHLISYNKYNRNKELVIRLYSSRITSRYLQIYLFI